MKIMVGIASTTHVDAHGEAFAKEALESMAERVQAQFVPLLRDHDFNQQLGVILCASVEQLVDGEHGLLVVTCVFENQDEASRFVNGAPNNVWQDYTHYLDLALAVDDSASQPATATVFPFDPAVDRNNIADMLEAYLDSTSVWRDGRVYKVKFLVARTGDLKIHVYRDHPPPHFHVLSTQRRINSRFDLSTLEPLDDSTDSRDTKKIQSYFHDHPDDLDRLRAEHARMQK